MNLVETSPDPKQSASRAELGHLLEEALLDLPEQYRMVVMLRDVEELSTSETAAALDLTEHNVKVRLHRGRAMASGWLFARVGTNAKSAFPFMGVRCDRVVHGVFARLAELVSAPSRRYIDALPVSNPAPSQDFRPQRRNVFNPQSNPQSAMPCMTSACFGSPRGLVSRRKTTKRKTDNTARANCPAADKETRCGPGAA